MTLMAGSHVFVRRHPHIAGRVAQVVLVCPDTDNGTKPCRDCGLGVVLALGNRRGICYGARPIDLERLTLFYPPKVCRNLRSACCEIACVCVRCTLCGETSRPGDWDNAQDRCPTCDHPQTYRGGRLE